MFHLDKEKKGCICQLMYIYVSQNVELSHITRIKFDMKAQESISLFLNRFKLKSFAECTIQFCF